MSRVFRQFSRRFGILHASEVQQYRTRGWVKVDNVFNAEETKALRGALVDLVQGGNLANVSTDGDGTTHSAVARSLQLCPLAPHASLFKMLPFHPRVAGLIQELLCDSPEESACKYLSQTFWKPARTGEGTSWHQDNAYFFVDRPNKGCGMWIPVHDSSIANGTLEVCDSASTILEHQRDPNSDHHITCNSSLDDSTATRVELKAGGAIFFDYNVPHRTGRNSTDSPRAAIAYHFLNTKDFRPRAFPLPENAEYVTPVMCGPDNSWGESEYGRRVWDAALWESEVASFQRLGDLEAREAYTTVKQDIDTKTV